ncbi:MAG: ComEC/Rec2 family competence protein [Acidobacteriaceae bacterium]
MDIPAPPTAMSEDLRTTRSYRPAPLRGTRRHAQSGPLNFSAAPMLLAAAGFALGVLDARWVWHPPLFTLLAALLGALLVLAALRYAERTLFLPLLLLWTAVGQFSAAVAPEHAASPALLHLADRLQREVTGTVVAVHPEKAVARYGRPATTPQTERTKQAEQTEQVDLALQSAEDLDSEHDWQVSVHGGLRLSVYARPGEALPVFSCGVRVRVTTRMAVPDRYLDPGAWDYPAYLRQHGINVLGSADAAAITVLPAADGPSLACLATAAQSWAGTRLERITTLGASQTWLPAWLRFQQKDSDLLRAMLFGDRSHLRHTLRTSFERTGSFHLLVVSGLHITIVIALFFWLARKTGLGVATATVVALSAAVPYAFLTGFAPPVQRALWLSGVYLVCRIFYRERAALNAVAIAALGVLVRDPAALFNASFQMTFLAVLPIAGVAAPLIEATMGPYLRGLRTVNLPSLDPHLPQHVTQMRVSLRLWSEHLRPLAGRRWAVRLPVSLSRWTLRAMEALLVSFIVEMAMMLPMAIYFHRITLYALPANMLGLPLLGFMLPLALLTFLLGCIQPMLALPLASLTALLLHGITALVGSFSASALSSFRIPGPPAWSIVCFLAAWTLALWMVRGKLRWKFAALAIVLAGSICVVLPQRPELRPGVLEVTAIDVGQGDSILVVTPDGHTLLVDAGGPIGADDRAGSSTDSNTDNNFDIGEEVVSQYLWSRHIRHLDDVALTHAHSDHMGGMPAVLDNFRPKALWVGNNPLVPTYRALLAEAKAENIQVQSWHAGQQFPFGATEVRVLAPAAGYEPGEQPSNDDTMVLRIAYGETSVLLEGDAEAPSERAMVANGLPATTLLKVGHHGSSTSTIPVFLQAVAPQYAVISDGRHNPFGFPRVPVLDALAAAHVRVYRTDTLGLCSFLLNGKTARQGEIGDGTGRSAR